MKKIKYSHILTASFFIVAALLIDYFFPREGKFRYKFLEGKPWRYELLTAPSDFPIYKTDEDVTSERDSVMRSFEPYFQLDQTVESTNIDKLSGIRNNPYVQYIEESLKNIYKNGIMTPAAYEQLREDNHTRIKLVNNNIATRKGTSEVYTVRTAYEAIINKAPPHLKVDSLRNYSIENLLVENISYDREMSDRVLNDMLHNIAIASGMVQAGERIVDRGEIIDSHTYNVLRSLKIVHETKTGGNKQQGIILLGQSALVFGIILCFWLYLWSFRLRVLYSRKNTLFLLLCIVSSCLLTEACIRQHLFNIYILPYAIVPIVVRTFFDSRTALFTHLTITLICSLMSPYPQEFFLLQTIAGMVVTFSLRDMSERSQLMSCAIFICLSYAISYTSMTLYTEADFSKIDLRMFLYFGINFILLMFAYVLVYMLEKTFGYVSSITLIELSNINKPLLKKLSEVAPGTFQHSMQVSILASEAVAKIGGNPSLVRTGALYHDIGKTANPAFFTENQANFNPHTQISYEQSAQIVIGHITEGVRIAEKASLPKAIIDFIRTHHGNGKAKYFYLNYKNQFPDKEIDESKFTYPGPKPFSKETAVLMMADSVEAASRSLKSYTEEEISNLVDRIIDSQIADGLLKNAPLTFLDVEKIKQVFVEKLKIAYHTRISYPEDKKKT